MQNVLLIRSPKGKNRNGQQSVNKELKENRFTFLFNLANLLRLGMIGRMTSGKLGKLHCCELFPFLVV